MPRKTLRRQNQSRKDASSSGDSAGAEKIASIAAGPVPPRWKFGLAAGLIALALAGGVLLGFHQTFEADMWWHLAQGREAAAGRLVRTNLFSGTYPNYPQPFTSWLFELGTFILWRIGGAAGIQAGQALLIALTLGFTYCACRRRATIPAVLAVEALGFFIIELRVTPRPHLASMALMPACALLIERAREWRSAIPLAWAILAIALWSNIHAECFFGAALVGMFAAGEFLLPKALPRRQAWIALALAAVCTAANMASPYGFGLFEYLWENAHASDVVQIAEFRPAYLPVYAPYFAYVFCGAGLLLWKLRKLALWELLVFGAFTALGLLHVRFVALSFCATAPIVAARLAEVLPKTVKAAIPVGVALCAGMLLSPRPAAVRFGQLGVGESFLAPPDIVSAGAISFIRSVGLKGTAFNSNNLGGYLIWNLYPEVRVFQDSRFQSYPPELFANIHEAYESQSQWDKLVAGVDWAVLSLSRRGPLSGAGRFPQDQWALVYQDDAIGIVVRRSGRFGALTAKYR